MSTAEASGGPYAGSVPERNCMCALLETPRTLRAGELARTLLKQKGGRRSAARIETGLTSLRSYGGRSTNCLFCRRATAALGAPCSVQSASSPRALGIGSSMGFVARLRSAWPDRAPHIRVAAMRWFRVATPASPASRLLVASCDDGESIQVDPVGAPCIAPVADRAIDRRRLDMLEDRARRRRRRGSLGSFVRRRRSVHHSLRMRLADCVSSRRRARRYGHRLRFVSARACGRVDYGAQRVVIRVCPIGKPPSLEVD